MNRAKEHVDYERDIYLFLTQDDCMELFWEVYGDIVEENRKLYVDDTHQILDSFLNAFM